MVTEEEIKKLAYSLWEQEGRADGRDLEFYFRAKQILEGRAATSLTDSVLEPPSRVMELTTPQPVQQLSYRE